MTDFIYRKENALSFDFCRSLIELFEIDKERQHRGVIRKEGKVQSADEHKISTDISFIPNDLQDKRWGKSLQRIINTVESARHDWITQYYMGLDVVDPFNVKIHYEYDDDMTGGVHNAFIYENHVYSVNNGRKFDIINIDDPKTPKRVGVYELNTAGHHIHDVWVIAGIAYS